jgi:NAD(P)-dependent dehydrogenase (short-subunit alcohol dehydrogenase family)
MTTPTNAVALITGASEGIGRALALELANGEDYPRLIISARNADRLEQLAGQMRKLNCEVLCVATDVSDPTQCQHLVQRTIEHFGRLDTLFNNAGATMWATFREITDLDVFRKVMDVNYFGALYCTHAAIEPLIASGGRIVVVASVAGLTGVPTRSGYAASKHAVIGLFESLRIELADTGVSVTIVAPDFVVSSIHRRALTADGTPLGTTPMKESRIMSAERCAALIAAATKKRQRILITSWRGRAGRLLRLVAPKLIDSIAARAIEKGQ